MAKVVTVDSNAIDSLFEGNGDVVRFARDFARDVVTFSRATYSKRGIGIRSSVLVNSTYSGGVLKEGRYRCRTSINNSAGYAAAVHDGTAGMAIRPTGPAMMVPRIRGSWGPGIPRFKVGPGFRKEFVRGQRAKPWIADAVEAVARSL